MEYKSGRFFIMKTTCTTVLSTAWPQNNTQTVKCNTQMRIKQANISKTT